MWGPWRGRIGEEVLGVDFDLNTIYTSMKLKQKLLGLSALSHCFFTQRTGREKQPCCFGASIHQAEQYWLCPLGLVPFHPHLCSVFTVKLQSRFGIQWKKEESDNDNDTISCLSFCLSPWLIFLLEVTSAVTQLISPWALHIAYCYPDLKIFLIPEDTKS